MSKWMERRSLMKSQLSSKSPFKTDSRLFLTTFLRRLLPHFEDDEADEISLPVKVKDGQFSHSIRSHLPRKSIGLRDNIFTGESNARANIGGDRNVPTGTYFYVITFSDENPGKNNYSGYLYINR